MHADEEAGYQCWYAHKALLWHMVSPTTGGYKPGRTFNTGRGTAIFVRKYASPWERLRFWLFLAAAIPAAFLRELPKGNQAAATAKLRGAIAGWKVPCLLHPAGKPAPSAAVSPSRRARHSSPSGRTPGSQPRIATSRGRR